MKRSKLEKVLEHMVNDEVKEAQSALHEYIIETARGIYQDLTEDDMEGFIDDEDEFGEFSDEFEGSGEDLSGLDADDWARWDDEMHGGEEEFLPKRRPDFEESIDISDESDDFESDIRSNEDEIETEEHFVGEEDDDPEMEMDPEMGGDMDAELDPEMGDEEMPVDGMDQMSGEVSADADVEDALVNVEDAIAELRQAFSDIMDGEEEVDDTMGDSVADEFGSDEEGSEPDMDSGEDMGSEEDERDLGEAATLKNQSVTMSGDEDGKPSPLSQNKPNISDHGNEVNIAGKEESTSKSAQSPKNMGVDGPQEAGGKKLKNVPKPKKPAGDDSKGKGKSPIDGSKKHLK